MTAPGPGRIIAAMSRHRAWLLLSAAALLLPAGAATAAPGAVTLLPLPTFSNGPQVTLTWDPQTKFVTAKIAVPSSTRVSR